MKSYPSARSPLVRDASPESKHRAESLVGLRSTDRAAHEEILNRAYLLWESEGRRENRALANWLQAEKELMAGT